MGRRLPLLPKNISKIKKRVEDRDKDKVKGEGIMFLLIILLCFIASFTSPFASFSQEIRPEGWSIPELDGLIPYSISVKRVDGVEKLTEKFYTPTGGHVARISGNGRIFAYAVDSDREPPIDYLLLDPTGSGKFIHKFGPQDSYLIPEWVSD
jgi:hypothetical protein